MITLITGTSGSGKSYLAVVMMLEELGNDRKVFSNIRLNIEDDNYEYIDEIELQKFFKSIEESFYNKSLEDAKIEYMKSKYCNALIMLDEVQFLGMKTYNKSISDWMTLQRHFSQDIVMVTQIKRNLSPVYQDLCHRYFDFTSSQNRILASHYQCTEYDSVGGEKVKTHMKKFDQRVFDIYKTGKAEGGMHPLMYKFFSIIATILVLVYFLIFGEGSVVNIVTDKKVVTINDVAVTTIDDSNHSVSRLCHVVMETKLKECSPNYVMCYEENDLFTELKTVCK